MKTNRKREAKSLNMSLTLQQLYETYKEDVVSSLGENEPFHQQY